jgi:hypothetical protein
MKACVSLLNKIQKDLGNAKNNLIATFKLPSKTEKL